MLVAFLGFSGSLSPGASGSARSNTKVSPSFVIPLLSIVGVYGLFVKNCISLTSSGEIFSSNSSLMYCGFSVVGVTLYCSPELVSHVLAQTYPSPTWIFFPNMVHSGDYICLFFLFIGVIVFEYIPVRQIEYCGKSSQILIDIRVSESLYS